MSNYHFTALTICIMPLFAMAQNTYPYPATGNIGIGTTSPVVKLSIYGTTDDEGAISLQSAGNSRFYIQQGGSLLKIGSITPGGAGAINVSNDGHTGIGPLSPRFQLHVSSNNTQALTVQNISVPSISSGAFVRCYNSGTPNAVNQRIGGILFGTNPTESTFQTGAQIESLTESSWTNGTSQPANLRFLTTDNGSAVVLERMRISASGNVGIGTTTPTQKLAVNGNVQLGLGHHFGTVLTDRFTYDGKYQPNYGVQWVQDTWSPSGPTLWAAAYGGIKLFTTGTPRMVITNTGNIGIGTTTPQAKLAVNGDLFAKKIKVVQTGWPDYVFTKDYALPPLATVEAYVRQHMRLPGIPSAAEIEKDGLDIGDMDRKLLQKIEELTLYVIEINKIWN